MIEAAATTQQAAGLGLAPVAARRALADEVYAALTASIMDHAIAPDTRLNIEEIARELGVSPTPVREALARLEADGLVAKEPLRGYRTTPVLTAAELDQMYEFRSLVEPWGAAEAARRRTAADVEELTAELATAPASSAGAGYADYAALAAHDHRFHVLLLRIAGNDVVREAFERTRFHLHQFRYAFAASMAPASVAEHRAIAEAVVAGDPEAARSAMTAHLRAARDRIVRSQTSDSRDTR